jgi:hypothetical protein
LRLNQAPATNFAGAFAVRTLLLATGGTAIAISRSPLLA